jgi:hypothetical protein
MESLPKNIEQYFRGTVMSIFLICFLVSFGLLTTFSCSSSTDNTEVDNGESATRTYSDNTGDVPYSLIDFDTLKIEIEDSLVVIRLSMVALPDTLIYDRREVPVNKLEYQWSATFDRDGDMTDSEGDIMCGLYRFKFDSVATEKSGPILAFTQKDISQYTANGTWHRVGPVQADITGSTINLYLGQSELNLLGLDRNELFKLPIKFESAYYKDQQYWEDRYPESGYVTRQSEVIPKVF